MTATTLPPDPAALNFDAWREGVADGTGRVCDSLYRLVDAGIPVPPLVLETAVMESLVALQLDFDTLSELVDMAVPLVRR